MMRHFGNRIDSDYGTSLIAIQPEPSRPHMLFHASLSLQTFAYPIRGRRNQSSSNSGQDGCDRREFIEGGTPSISAIG